MGNDLGELFTALADDLTFLFWQWQSFSELYHDKKTRFEIMNRAAPFFFWVLQRSWWDEALLSVTRLVAPPQSMGQPNLTFRRLPAAITDPHFSAEIADAVSSVVGKAEFAKTWRNKRIAHRDLDVALKRAQPLPPAKWGEVDVVLHDLVDILNRIQMRYLNGTTMYARAPIVHGSKDLLYLLREGLRRDEVRQQKLEKGEYQNEDWDDDAPPI